MPSQFTVICRLEYKPIPARCCDWEAWVVGDEERTTVTAPTYMDALRELASRLEDVDYGGDNAEEIAGDDKCHRLIEDSIGKEKV